jgi:hypothetical protein
MIQGSGVRRFHLQAAQDCLAWMYGTYSRPDRCQIDFWAWAGGMESWWFSDPNNPVAKQLLSDSADWPWFALQRRARRLIESIFGGLAAGSRPVILLRPRALGVAWPVNERRALRWITPRSRARKPWDQVLSFIDELLSNLDGANVEVLGKCGFCSHWFVRAAARRKGYCSDTCRNRSRYQRRKNRPGGRKRRRVA